MERSVSLICSGAGGGPAGLAGTASDAVVAAKKESIETTGGTGLPGPGFIDVLREAARGTLEEPDARTAPCALRFSDDRDTSGRRDAAVSSEWALARVVEVAATADGTVLAVPAALAPRVMPDDPAPVAAAFIPPPLSRIPDDAAAAEPVFNQPAGAMGSSGSRAPPRPPCEAAGRASGKRSE